MGFQIKRLLRSKNKNSGVAFKSESSVASKCYGQLCMYSDSKILINTVTFWRQWDKKKLHTPQTLPQNISGWWECFIHTKMIAWTQKSGGERLLLSVSFRELRRLSFYYAPKISLAQGNSIIFRARVKVIPTIQNQHWLKKCFELFELWSEYPFVVILLFSLKINWKSMLEKKNIWVLFTAEQLGFCCRARLIFVNGFSCILLTSSAIIMVWWSLSIFNPLDANIRKAFSTMQRIK